jgi:hypothetical protein
VEEEPKNEHPFELPTGTGRGSTLIEPTIETEPAAAESPIKPVPIPTQSIKFEGTSREPPMEPTQNEIKAVGLSNGDEVKWEEVDTEEGSN